MSLLLTGFALIASYDAIAPLLSFHFLLSKRAELSSLSTETSTLFVIVPLLHEQVVLPSLVEGLVMKMRLFQNVRLLFITTERERYEDSKGRITTMKVLESLIPRYPDCENRIYHVHLLKCNRVIAEQLNCGLNCIATTLGYEPSSTYVMLINADSVIGADSIEEVLRSATAARPVLQQPSLYLHNMQALCARRSYLVAAHGVYQSCWTLAHEIPRYLIAQIFYRIGLPSGSALTLAHCVGHGLTCRLDILRAVGGFLENDFGGEDLALGYVFQVGRIPIHPGRILENAQSPPNFAALQRQLCAWFMAVSGYPDFVAYAIRSSIPMPRLALWWQTGLGVIDGFRWLLKGPIILVLFYWSLRVHAFPLFLMTYAVYCYGPVLVLLALWKHLPPDRFPMASAWNLVLVLAVYPLVPIVRSLPAFTGLIQRLRLRFGYTYRRPRTEKEM
jgi:hypothetical protein